MLFCKKRQVYKGFIYARRRILLVVSENMFDKYREVFQRVWGRPLYASMIFFVVVFFCIFSVFYVAGGDPVPDDNYFHFKFAELIRTNGFDALQSFDWIYLSNTAQNGGRYTVSLHQFLLIPFTFFTNKLVGMHAATTFYISVFVTILFYIMQKERVKGSVFFALTTISTTYVLTRMLLGRAFGVMVGLIFLEMYLAIHKKYKWLCVISFVHVLLHYSTYFIPIIVVGIVELVRYLMHQKIAIKNGISVVIGVIVGMAFFPGFPGSLFGRIRENADIQNSGVEAVSGSIGGAELATKDFMTYFVGQNLMFFAIVFCVVAVLFLYYFVHKKGVISVSDEGDRTRLHWAYALFFFLLFVMCGSVVVSGRFFDFVLPTVVLLSAFVITVFLHKEIFIIDRRYTRWFAVGCYIWIGVIMIHMMIFLHMKSRSFDYEPAGAAAAWIDKNSDGREKVYLHNWGNFSLMFFGNTDDVYSTGIEPAALRGYDEGLYWKYYNILKHNYYCETSGDCRNEMNQLAQQLDAMGPGYKEKFMKKNSANIINSIRNDFDAHFVLSDSTEFDSLMFMNPDLIESWQTFDSERYSGPHTHFTVFKLK